MMICRVWAFQAEAPNRIVSEMREPSEVQAEEQGSTLVLVMVEIPGKLQI